MKLGCFQLFLTQLHLAGRAASYVRLVGIELAIFGFNYIVIGRTKPRASGEGYILNSIPERIILLNGLFLIMKLTDTIPLSVFLFTVIINSLLAVVAFVIWYKTTENATFGTYFKETFSPLLVRCIWERRGPAVAVHVFGVLQLLAGLIFSIRPDYAKSVFRLDPFQDHAAGYLAAFFALLSASAWQQIYMGKVVCVAFNIATVFTRLAFKIPILVILVASRQIEIGLFSFLIVLDFAFGVIVLMLLCLEGVMEGEGDEETDSILKNKAENDSKISSSNHIPLKTPE